jgi:acyl-coenzyme A synthetase/AMP-(fatty) acid ligase
MLMSTAVQIVYKQRPEGPAVLKPGRDLDWDDWLARCAARFGSAAACPFPLLHSGARMAGLQAGCRIIVWRLVPTRSANHAHDAVEVNANDPLYILYTSGTTGAPKGVVRDNGGHAVALAWCVLAVVVFIF